ncbi:MAG: proline--tRNA ligase [Actinobacteria bacterium]|nr:proline--tRNA ligase [Actinomycetota bacterium]
MRWSRAYIPTLRDDPTDAEAISHKLLVRGGFIRQLMAGSYSLLPLGKRVADKVIGIIRQEIEAIGGVEFELPVVHPGEVWKRTGRWDSVGDELLRIKDRRGADLALALTHEEIFTLHAGELASYRDLPQLWYHFQTKFRDEPRAKGGLLRVREFVMKDSYSFDLDTAGLDVQFDRHFEAYKNVFRRIGTDAVSVEASSGVMGGTESIEFMVRSDSGEDDIAICPACDYAANTEKATSALPAFGDQVWKAPPERFPTPGIRTIAALQEAEGFASAPQQIKTLAYVIDGQMTLLLLRGDHELMEQKLIDGTGTADIRPAHPEEIRRALGADPGSLGAVGVSHLPVIADPALEGRTNMVTGANEDDWHLRGVDVARDIEVSRWLDLRKVKAGEACPRCGAALALDRVIEVGHIFKLGTKYTEALGVTVLDPDGIERLVVMGSYGIGIGRAVAAAVEANHDESGIAWPAAIAPYEAVVTVVKADDPATLAAADEIYRGLLAAGVDVIINDRDERPGVKFADAELIGFPYRVTVGPRGLADGEVEVMRRRGRDKSTLPVGEAVAVVAAAITAERTL